jgi:hypothetical protein
MWWRHPRAIAVVHGTRVLFGTVAVIPLAHAVASLLGPRAGVDATLLDGGGLLLPDVFAALRTSRPVTVSVALTSLLVGVVATLAATIGLLDAMARPGARPLRTRGVAIATSLPALGLLWLVATLLQGAIGYAVFRCGAALAAALPLDERSADLARLLALSVAVVAASLVVVVHDLAMAAVAGLRLRLADGLVVGWAALRASPLRLMAAHLARSTTAAALLASAALLAIRIGMRASRDALLTQALLEVALIAATCLRASWLGIALQAVAAARGGSALPDDRLVANGSPSQPP